MTDAARLLAVCELLTEVRNDLDPETVVAAGAEQLARLARVDLGAVVVEGPDGLIVGSYPRPVAQAEARAILERSGPAADSSVARLAVFGGPEGAGRGVVAAMGPLDGQFSLLDEWLTMVLARRVQAQLEMIQLHRERMADAEVVRENQLAGELQQALMPSAGLEIGRFEIAGSLRPARHVGGDFYDVYQVDDEAVVVIADVSGKGAPASLLTASVHAASRHAVAEAGAEPSEVVRRIASDIAPLLDRTGRIVTVGVVATDSVRQTVRVASAGHSPVVVRRRRSPDLVVPGGPPIGTGDFDIPETVLPVAEGDLVLVASDGVTDQRRPDGASFGTTRLLEIIRRLPVMPATEVVTRLVDAVDQFADSQAQDDDQTTVALVIGASASPVSAAERRGFIVDLKGLAELEGWVERVVEAAAPWLEPRERLGVRLGLHEILVNVFRHAYHGAPGPCSIVITSGRDTCSIELVDQGAPFEGPQVPELPLRPATSGYGLRIAHGTFDEVSYGRVGDENRWSLVIERDREGHR